MHAHLPERVHRLAAVALDEVEDIVLLFGPDFCILHANRAAQRSLGRSAEALVGRNFWTEFPALHDTPFGAIYRRAMAERVEMTTEGYYPPKDAFYRARAIPSADGLVVTVRDVSAIQKHAIERETLLSQERAARSEAEAERRRLKKIIAHLPARVALLEGPEHRYAAVNATLQQAFAGLDLIGRPFAEVHPEQLTSGQVAVLDRVRARGERAAGTEVRGLAQPGAYFNYVCEPILGEDGTVQFILLFILDVTAQVLARQRTEELADKLERSQALLGTVVEQAPIGIGFWDEDLRFALVNKALATINGLPVAEHLGKTVAELLPGVRPEVMDAFRRVMRSGEPFSHETYGETPAEPGKTHTWSVSYYPVRVRNRQIGVGAVCEDITERKHAEALRAENERQFHTLAETMAHMVFTARPDGTHEYFNKKWHQYTGIGIDPAWGHALSWVSLVHADAYAAAHAAWLRSLQTGQPYQFECPIRSADGTYRWFLIRAVPLLDAQGQVVRWFGTCTDIDEQRRMIEERARLFEALQERESQVTALIENLPELAWTARPDGRFEFLNQRFYDYTGATHEQLQGEGWLQLHDPALAGEIRARWQRNLETGEPFEMEFPLRGADGVLRWFLTRVRPLRDARGRILRWIGINTDIDWRKRAEAVQDRLIRALARSNADLDQFAHAISHDLKAPLRGIGNLAQWIEEDAGSSLPDVAREHIGTLKGRVQQLSLLIDGVLSYARAGRAKTELQQVDVGALLTEVRELLAPPPPATVTARTALPILLTERGPLQQVFLNLIGNAIKHGHRPDVEVCVSAWERADHWEFAVSDNGPGIAPEDHERIWGLFQTLDHAAAGSGSGIGLSVVKRLIEARGGRVSIESVPGCGATFRFTWPKRAEA